MSRHDPLVTLRQIEDFARQAATLGVEGSRQELDSDWKYLLAAERAVELIGEAATPFRQNCATAIRKSHGVKSSGCGTG